MIKKKFLTTGEAAKALDISRSTVTRKFDKDELQGKKHPITGERLISRESILEFMKQYNLPDTRLPVDRKKILVVASETRLLSLVAASFGEDKRIDVQKVPFGCDALVLCPRERFDVLVLAEELPDISPAEVIKALRRCEDLSDMKILCCVGEDVDTKDLGADKWLAQATLTQAVFARSVYHLLEITGVGTGDEQGSRDHARRWARVPVNFNTKLGFYPVSVPSERSVGRAAMRNLSKDGAYLDELVMDDGRIPGEPFRVLLEVDQPPLERWQADCRVVRLQSNGSLGVGVQFLHISQASQQKMVEILDA